MWGGGKKKKKEEMITGKTGQQFHLSVDSLQNSEKIPGNSHCVWHGSKNISQLSAYHLASG